MLKWILPSPEHLGYYTHHPFNTVPDVEYLAKVVQLEPFWLQGGSLRRFGIHCALREARTVMEEKSLGPASASKLMREVARIISRYTNNPIPELDILGPDRVLAHLGTRVFAVDMVLAAYQMFGDNLNQQEWWDDLMNAVQSKYNPPNEPTAKTTNGKMEIIRQCEQVLRFFKQTGQRLNPQDNVVLKHRLLNSAFTAKIFQTAAFQPWRDQESEYTRRYLYNVASARGPAGYVSALKLPGLALPPITPRNTGQVSAIARDGATGKESPSDATDTAEEDPEDETERAGGSSRS